jgi:hypothetical protein
MNDEKVLALDVSTKTGYAFATSSLSGIKLHDYGTLKQIHQPDSDYPGSFVDWAHMCFDKIMELIDKFKPEVLVVEETSKGSKNAMSQKILEYIHYLLAKFIKESGIKSVYIMTEQWRREIGCKMNDEEKAKNKAVRDYKKAYKKKHGKKTSVAYDINGKRIGIVGRKHLNIRRANEIFGDQLKTPLRRKDEDLADGLGLLASYHGRRLKPISDSNEMTFDQMIKG